MRYMLLVPAVLLAWNLPLSAAQQPPAAPAQPPAAPAPPLLTPEQAAELERQAQLDKQLKELQRRVEFDSLDLETREDYLRQIIDLCIELGRDFALYQTKLKETQEERKKQTALRNREQLKLQRHKLAVEKAKEAIAKVPPDWKLAGELLELAVRSNPADAEARELKALVDREQRQILIYRSVFGALVGLAGTGLIVGLVKYARKGPGKAPKVRRLEMIEGPEPGRIFELEKEITTIGAVAAEADWAIADPTRRLSRRHFDISRSGRHYFLTDLSSNGTLINGKAAPKGEPVLLRRGDRITIAEDITLRFR